MGRIRSFEAKDRISLPVDVSSPKPSIVDNPASSRSRSSFVLWFCGFGMVALSGYGLGEAAIGSVNDMWISDLFSEYIPPTSVHIHLSRERNRSLTEDASEPSGLWDPPKSNGWKPCLGKIEHTLAVHYLESKYLQVFCTGGLFQLHICVCNAVTVAWLLNASLVIPHFQESSVWKDPSEFEDIYDIDHFILSLKQEVQIVRELPPEYGWSTPEYYNQKCFERPNCLFLVPKHSRKEWYFENVLPVLQSYGVAVLDRFHHKLAFEGLPADATRLRCKANFYALRFSRPIANFGNKLVNRMHLRAKYIHKLSLRSTSSRKPTSGQDVNGNETKEVQRQEHVRFVGIHMRFEKDMIAHSACYYGGGRAEQRALASFRRKTFRNFVPKAQFSSEYLRRNGSCPLTPEEVGLLLTGLGFKNSTPLYLAGKQSYGGEARLKPLRNVFPYLENKFSLASKEELHLFLPFSHRLAALDFIVLLSSEVFMSNSAGNFANVLSGYRTFIGPRKSIHPDKATLFTLFSNTSLSWDDFSLAVAFVHKDRLGAPHPRKEKYSIFRYPAPDCMCQHAKN